MGKMPPGLLASYLAKKSGKPAEKPKPGAKAAKIMKEGSKAEEASESPAKEKSEGGY
jgi:hypothetical protein